jgi:glycosyltransferase involved in cell wall biosynthesis
LRIVIVSYFAPPQAAVASHRVLRLSRELERNGHEVHWITQDPERILKRDDTLADLIPDSVVVHALGGPTVHERPVARNLPEKVLRTLAHLAPRWVAVPDGHLEWAWRLWRRLPALVKRIGADVVLLCCGPHGQILAVPRLRRLCPDVRILVDYRDLLSGNSWNDLGRERVAGRLLRRERRILARADALFVNTEDARQRFVERVGEIPGLPVSVMRNAADYELADRIAANEPATVLGPGCNLGFYGTLFPRRRLLPVLQALARWSDHQLDRTTVHVYCDARDSKRLLEEDVAAVPAAVGRRVARHELLPFARALRSMQAMDVLLLVNSPHEEDAIFVPGKLYDYLMARRPIAFVGCPGDAARIVARACGDAWSFGHDQPDLLADRLRDALERRLPDLPPCDEFAPAKSFAPLLASCRLSAKHDRASCGAPARNPALRPGK